jgi:hypothetical protein
MQPPLGQKTSGAGFRLSERDHEILDTLTHRVRVLSLIQIARTWWPSADPRDAVRRLETLQGAGLLYLFQVLSHPEIALREPQISWQLGERPPDFGSASYRLKARWNRSPTSAWCAIATALSARSRGGHGGRFPRESEITHDIHMAAVYLRYRSHDPSCVQNWRSEARILWERGGLKNEKLPDAILDTSEGQRIIEFGGGYAKQKLERFHAYCERIATPYEVW